MYASNGKLRKVKMAGNHYADLREYRHEDELRFWDPYCGKPVFILRFFRFLHLSNRNCRSDASVKLPWLDLIRFVSFSMVTIGRLIGMESHFRALHLFFFEGSTRLGMSHYTSNQVMNQ